VSVYNNFSSKIGRVCNVPEIKEFDKGTVANFRIAVYRSGKGETAVTDFFTVNAWHDLARGSVSLNKGDMVIVIGQDKAEYKQLKDGSKQTYYSITAGFIGKSIAIHKEEDNEEPF